MSEQKQDIVEMGTKKLTDFIFDKLKDNMLLSRESDDIISVDGTTYQIKVSE